MRRLACLLYLPLILITGALAAFCLLLLAHGERSGFFILLYAPVCFILSRRARKIYAAEEEAADCRKDVWLLGVADIALLALLISFLL